MTVVSDQSEEMLALTLVTEGKSQSLPSLLTNLRPHTGTGASTGLGKLSSLYATWGEKEKEKN